MLFAAIIPIIHGRIIMVDIHLTVSVFTMKYAIYVEALELIKTVY